MILGIVVTMFVYLDESGDPGFKFRQQSSTYFVITLLLVEDPLPLHSRIDEIRRELGYEMRPEFKFFSSKDYVREAFLHGIRQQDFAIRALVVDKRKLTNPHMQTRETFYNVLVRQVLQHDNGMINEATLVLDRSVKSKRVQRAMGTYLRRMLNAEGQRKIAGIKHHDSRGDNLIQAVDMVSGAIYANYHRGEPHYLSIIRRRIQDLWEFEPRT